MNALLLHPDDVLPFTKLVEQMQRVAKNYDLPLKSVRPFTMPKEDMADRMGECTHDGHIRIVMRCMKDGIWADGPISPDELLDTAAHELAHLQHFNHGDDFQVLFTELLSAMRNQQEDHRQKIIKKLVKMQASAASEAKLGNSEAAETFAAAINRMLIEYELNPTDLDYARATDDDPVIQVEADLAKYDIPQKKHRIAWQEELARIVANAHLCQFLVHRKANSIWFVGTRAHAVVAEYVYCILVRSAFYMSDEELFFYQSRVEMEGQPWKAKGFQESWLSSFVHRVRERLDEERKKVIAEETARHQGLSNDQALMRLSGALVKAQKYVDDMFRGRKDHKPVHALNMGYGSNYEGRTAGRAAADRMPIGRRGVDPAAKPKGHLA